MKLTNSDKHQPTVKSDKIKVLVRVEFGESEKLCNL